MLWYGYLSGLGKVLHHWGTGNRLPSALAESAITLDELILRRGAPFYSACEQLRERAEGPCDQTVVLSVTLRGGRQTNLRVIEVIPVKVYQNGFYLEWRSGGHYRSMPRLFWCKSRRPPREPGDEPLALIERDWFHLKTDDEDALIRTLR